MRTIPVSCPVCRSTIAVYEDELKPSGTCGRCSTRIELAPAAFLALFARADTDAALGAEVEPARAAPPPPEPRRPPAPLARAPEPPAPEAQSAAPEPESPAPAEPAVPLPQGRIVMERDDHADRSWQSSEPVTGAQLDLFESPARGGIVGAYFHRRKRRGTQVPTWLVVWLIVLAALMLGGIAIYLIWLSL